MSPSRLRIRVTLVGLVALACAFVVAPSANAVGSTPTLQVGQVSIPPCAGVPGAWCTTVQVPFDYGDPSAGTIGIGFRWYAATTPPSTGARTILATEGGPGYPSTGTSGDYKALFAPLMTTHNLLLVDLRGTGTSSVVKCNALQHWTVDDGNAAYITDTGACGDQLNSTVKRPDGSSVDGADLYTTANAARDVATVIGLLQTGKVDFYGDSYGTFFGQTFTARYPNLLRSVTLDAAYPVSQSDPWYPHAIQTAHTAFDAACSRSVACAAEAPGSSWARVGAFVAQLRTAPITGVTKTPDGDDVTVTVDPDALAELVADAGADNGVYKELDPAIRAAQAGDTAPLLRLAAQESDAGDSGAYKDFSAGLYEAVSCSDYPAPFNYADSDAQRQAEYNAARTALPNNEFAPFTIHEWTTNSDEEFDSCLDWPAPVNNDPPIVTPPPYAPANLPVLVLSGDLDSLTTPAEGQQVVADMGQQTRWVLFANDTHVNALEDSVGCAEGIVRAFVTAPGTLNQIDTSCASSTPEVRVDGDYPTVLSDVTAATAGPANAAGVRGRRLAAVGAAALGDAIWHDFYVSGKIVNGLRGGTVKVTGSGPYTLTFHDDAWTTDTTVNGTATWDESDGQVTAHLTVAGSDTSSATVVISYADRTPHSVATVTGTFDGQAIVATMPAP
jgi:pimeloyl-ACP methyl ester carboxylesterase